MYHVHHASICVNVVIGVLVVLNELHVTRVVVVVVDAVVGLTLGLIAHVVVVVFVVATLHRIFCFWRYTLHTLKKLRDRILRMNRLGLSWTDKGSRFSLTVKRGSENTNSRLIMTEEVYKS